MDKMNKPHVKYTRYIYRSFSIVAYIKKRGQRLIRDKMTPEILRQAVEAHLFSWGVAGM